MSSMFRKFIIKKYHSLYLLRARTGRIQIFIIQASYEGISEGLECLISRTHYPLDLASGEDRFRVKLKYQNLISYCVPHQTTSEGCFKSGSNDDESVDISFGESPNCVEIIVLLVVLLIEPEYVRTHEAVTFITSWNEVEFLNLISNFSHR